MIAYIEQVFQSLIGRLKTRLDTSRGGDIMRSFNPS